MTDERYYRKVELISSLTIDESGQAFGVRFEVTNLKSREEAESCRNAMEALLLRGFVNAEVVDLEGGKYN